MELKRFKRHCASSMVITYIYMSLARDVVSDVSHSIINRAPLKKSKQPKHTSKPMP